MKNEPPRRHREAIPPHPSPEMFVIASSLEQTGQNQEDGDRKLDRKWFKSKAARQEKGGVELRCSADLATKRSLSVHQRQLLRTF